MTLLSALHGGGNAITPLRLGLAVLVVFSHAFVAGGYGADPLFTVTGGQMQLGSVAVIGFFGLSGFLIARSRETSSSAAYLRNRALRILPGLWVCLAMTVLIVVPIAIALGGSADPEQLRRFVVHAATFQPLPVAVEGLYGTNAEPDVVNAPLWTLPPEVLCYLLLCLMPRRVMRTGCLVVLVVVIVANTVTSGELLYLHLPIAFLTGTLLYVGRARVPLGGRWVALGAVALILAAAVGRLGVVAPVVLPYVVLWIAFAAPTRLRADVSYGTYIYGWPIQELLAMAGIAALGVVPYFFISLVPILAVAYASWRLVERPALRFRSREAVAAAEVLPPVAATA